MGNGGWTNDTITTLVIPTGATTGLRIVIDGTTGIITGYDANNNVVDIIEPEKIIVQAPDGSQIMLRSDLGYAALNMTPSQNTGTYDAGQIRGTTGFNGAAGATEIRAAQKLPSSGTSYIMLDSADGVNPVHPIIGIYAHLGSILVDSASVDLGVNKLGWSGSFGNADDVFLYRTTAVNPQLTTEGAITFGTAGVAETWNAVTLLNGFTNGTPVMQYRRVASPPNCVQVFGFINSGATVASGTAIGQLPAAYRPASHTVALQVSNASTGVNLWLGLQADGNLALHGTWANGNAILINGLFAIDL